MRRHIDHGTACHGPDVVVVVVVAVVVVVVELLVDAKADASVKHKLHAQRRTVGSVGTEGTEGTEGTVGDLVCRDHSACSRDPTLGICVGESRHSA